MPRADQVLALVRSHLEGNSETFKTIALQLAAHEAKNGHQTLAREMRDLIQAFDDRNSVLDVGPTTIHIAQPRGELANLVSAAFPTISVDDMELSSELLERLCRILNEQKRVDLLREHGLHARRKLLLVGPPGTGKTMTAKALAGQLNLPLFTILLEGVITRYMGESSAKLKVVFDAMTRTRAVFLFDEFDAIGAKRTATNDVGEIRRILNAFLQFLENDQSESIIVCATNHSELLDRALYRRFDDVLEYRLPDSVAANRLLRQRLISFDLRSVRWGTLGQISDSLSQAEIVRAGDDVAKRAILEGCQRLTTKAIELVLAERRAAQEMT